MAERSGLHAQGISQLERGLIRSPRSTTVEFLADALQLDAHEKVAFAAAARGAWGRRPPDPGAGLPPDPVPHFVDREVELAELARLLRRSGRVALHGLGGVGKTQLVVRYLHQRRAEYPEGVFWLRADGEANLLGDLASLAWRLDLPEREVYEQERQVAAVVRWLRERGEWLLVLDNLEPLTHAAVERWLAPGLSGHLLVTSRTPMWPARLALEPLSVETAARYLLQRTAQDDVEAAAAVAEALGGLPLALAQAAAYLEVTGRDLASYAALLETRLFDLLGEGQPEGYPRPAATTWQLSFERLEHECPAAAALLRLCAFLAPDDIPVGVLREGAGAVPYELCGTLGDDLELDRSVAALRRYSLVDREGDRLRVHRLVQAVVRETLGAERQRAWLAAAIRLLEATFPEEPEEHPEEWPLCARLLAHAQSVAQLAGPMAAEGQALCRVLRRAGLYGWARGQYEPALALLERALALRERDLGSDHPDTAESLDDLGLVRLQRGELAVARPLFERALAIRERALGPDHPAVATTLNNLAGVLVDRGEPAAALPLIERALAIRESALGPDHPRTAVCLVNLGFLLKQRGDLTAARPLLERAAASMERTRGADHPRTAACFSNLAGLLRDLGELAAARRLYERTLAIRERLLGPDHPSTARSLHLLGLVRRQQGDLAAAAALLQQALTVYSRALTPDHHWAVESQRALDLVHREWQAQPADGP